MTTLFCITKLFTCGLLKGLYVREVTSVRFVEGRNYGSESTGRYTVVLVSLAQKGSIVGVLPD